jgi:hypothetical protein
MKISIIKLVFPAVILFIPGAFSQTNAQNSYLTLYSNWLKINHLDQFIRIDVSASINSTKVDSTHAAIRGHKGKVKLILTPAAVYTDPLKFASDWNNLHKGLEEKGINFYNVLLTRLADYTVLPPDSVAVEIQTGNAEIFSLKIHYDHEENIVLLRGTIAGPDFNFNYAAALMKENCFVTVKPERMDMINRKLYWFFSKYKYGSYKKIESLIYHDGKKLKLTVLGIKGEVTGNYHEIIYLDVSLENSEICYTVE